jgi:hypothetical protein
MRRADATSPATSERPMNAHAARRVIVTVTSSSSFCEREYQTPQRASTEPWTRIVRLFCESNRGALYQLSSDAVPAPRYSSCSEVRKNPAAITTDGVV